MTSRFRTLPTLLVLATLCLSNPVSGETTKRALSSKSLPREASGVLWREPTDIASKDLLYGAGGKEREPKGPFRFVKEDMGGSNPKFVIEDARGTAWKVKLGPGGEVGNGGHTAVVYTNRGGEKHLRQLEESVSEAILEGAKDK